MLLAEVIKTWTVTESAVPVETEVDLIALESPCTYSVYARGLFTIKEEHDDPDPEDEEPNACWFCHEGLCGCDECQEVRQSQLTTRIEAALFYFADDYDPTITF